MGMHQLFLSSRATSQQKGESDDGSIAVVPYLPGCSAFGDTREEALKEIRTALSLWLETAKEIGKEIPPGIFSCNVQSERTDADYITA